MEQKEKWREEFDKKFTAVFAWITMNCMNEIIQGVDINHLHAILKEHIESLLSSQAHALKKKCKRALPKKEKYDVFTSAPRVCEIKGFNDCREQTLSAIESIEI